MAINGKQGAIEKVDTYTVRFKFPEPYYMLPDVLAGSTDLAGQWGAYRGMGGFAPAHYLKQFHPKYVGEAELDKKVKDAKYDSWVRMFHGEERLGAQPGAAGALAVEDGDADQHADLDARAQPVQRLRGHGG